MWCRINQTGDNDGGSFGGKAHRVDPQLVPSQLANYISCCNILFLEKSRASRTIHGIHIHPIEYELVASTRS